MSVPSQMSLRRIPTCLHLTIRVAYASAWEALVRTHTDQAVQFIQEFAPRIAPLEGSAARIADELRAYAQEGIAHVQLVVDPIDRASIEGLAPVLAELDRG